MSIEIKSATLLSIEEAKTLLTKEERKYGNWWWLRSPVNDQNYVAYVSLGGSVLYNGDFIYVDNVSVRPALNIDFDSSDLKIGDVFDFGGKKFRIISDNLAFCLEDIGKRYFTLNWRAKTSNVYEFSDVKRFVDSWFKDAKKEEQN